MPNASFVGILLAAGSASRFGSDKLLHRLPDGVPVAIASALALQEVLEEVIAVVAEKDQPLSHALEAFGIRCVENRHANTGMGSSLAAGIQATPNASGWLIALADMPWVESETIRQLVQQLNDGVSIIAPEHAGHRGHPVGFSARWKDRLSQLDGDQGARNLLVEYPEQLELIHTNDQGVLLDIDRPEDITVSFERGR